MAAFYCYTWRGKCSKCRSCHKSWLKFSPKYLNVIALFILSEISKSLLSIRKHQEMLQRYPSSGQRGDSKIGAEQTRN